MRDKFDFSRARHGPVIDAAGKTRITIYLDDEVLAAFRDRAGREGKGYQTLINETLCAAIAPVPHRSRWKHCAGCCENCAARRK